MQLYSKLMPDPCVIACS